jgi:AraC family transcriptional regulator of adaptative response/methylated-DNA-[protein]-cysteine methyltransferase
VPGEHRHLDQIEHELEAYFGGRSLRFDTPLRLDGSQFQIAVWQALLAIPAGSTRSYADIAAAIERPAAVRAVGRANGDNNLSIVVPCHRVIGADGALTGYGGGLWRKAWLLEHERTHSGGRGQRALPGVGMAVSAVAPGD